MRSYNFYVKFYSQVKYDDPDYHQKIIKRVENDIQATYDFGHQRLDSPGSIKEIMTANNVFNSQEKNH